MPTEPFDDFTVVILGHNTMQCKTWVPKPQVTVSNYTFVDIFYVFYVADTNVVLGVQWLYSIGEHIVNYQIPEMKFQVERCTKGCERAKHLPKSSSDLQQYEIYIDAQGHKMVY